MSAPDRVFTTFIRATPEAIWRALTQSDFTTRYYFGSSVASDWTAGSRYEYRIAGELQIEGEVIASEPPTRLVTSFHPVWSEAVAAHPVTTVTFEIEPAGPGVSKVSIVHGGLEEGSAVLEEVTGGWPLILAGLKTLLETGQPMMSPAPA